MPMSLPCPTCGTKLKAPEVANGRKVKCPKCGKPFLVKEPEIPEAELVQEQVAVDENSRGVRPADYQRMRRALVLLRARQEVRAMLDAGGFGDSVMGRLALAFAVCAFLFGASLILSFVFHHPPPYAIAQAAAVFIVGFIPVLALVVGPNDEQIAKQLDFTATNLPKAEAAWQKHNEVLAAERLRQEQASLREEQEEHREAWRERALQHSREVQGPSVVILLPAKSVGVSILLTFFFGPLGMLYSTVPGALVMMAVNVFVGCLTFGLGLAVTWPICIIWGAVAVSSYNQKLLRDYARY